MMTRKLVLVSAAIEAATGVALIADPNLVANLLLGAGLSGAGTAVGRVGGFGLLCLGLACLPNRDGVTARVTWVLFVYNLLAAVYLGYLSFGGIFVSNILYVAFGLHALLTILLAHPAYAAVSAAKVARGDVL
jgi:hypothetical protein